MVLVSQYNSNVKDKLCPKLPPKKLNKEICTFFVRGIGCYRQTNKLKILCQCKIKTDYNYSLYKVYCDEDV